MLEETLMAAGLLVGGLIVMAIAEVIFAMSLAAFHSERIADILERQELEHAQEKRRADLNKIESRFDRDPLGIYRQKDEEPEEAE